MAPCAIGSEVGVHMLWLTCCMITAVLRRRATVAAFPVVVRVELKRLSIPLIITIYLYKATTLATREFMALSVH